MTKHLLTIQEVAQATGVSAPCLRTWETRFGWPTPHRTRHGCRRYTADSVAKIRSVAARVHAGEALPEIIREGRPCLAPAVVPPPRPNLDFTAIPCPLDDNARCIRDRLICGLVQRHPGIVRWAASSCDVLHPDDRGPAVLNILTAYRQQVADHAWLDAALEHR
jgi:hypothetical protein